MARRPDWRKKTVEQWDERDQLDFCRHLMEPVIELMAVRILAVMKEAAKPTTTEGRKDESA